MQFVVTCCSGRYYASDTTTPSGPWEPKLPAAGSDCDDGRTVRTKGGSWALKPDPGQTSRAGHWLLFSLPKSHVRFLLSRTQVPGPAVGGGGSFQPAVYSGAKVGRGAKSLQRPQDSGRVLKRGHLWVSLKHRLQAPKVLSSNPETS